MILLQFGDGRLGLIRQPVPRIAVQELLERGQRFLGILEVVFVDFANREQRVEAVSAARVFLAQEFVFLDRVREDLVVVEAAAHLNLQLSDGDDAGIGFGRSRRAEINAAVGVDHALVVVAGSLRDRATIQSFAHALSPREVIARPGVAVPHTSIARQRWKQRQKRHTQTQPALASK